MTEREMFEKCFESLRDFANLSNREQWEIDKRLGILDWQGERVNRCRSRAPKRIL
jgi:hypothetical protein